MIFIKKVKSKAKNMESPHLDLVTLSKYFFDGFKEFFVRVSQQYWLYYLSQNESIIIQKRQE